MIALPHMSGKTVGILGLGASGLATAEALKASGSHILCWDDNSASRARAEAKGLVVQDFDAANIDCLVTSPGIALVYPKPHAKVAAANLARVPVCGDVELFAQVPLGAAKIIGITGTNGKSTTTALITHLLLQAGQYAVPGGNFGPPVLSLPGDAEIYVLELSSFQLEQTASLACDVSVFLNLTPDHGDRYASMQSYSAAKQKLLAMQKADQTAVIAVDDDTGRAFAQAAPCAVTTASSSGRSADWSVEAGALRHGQDVLAYQSDWAALQGPHNAQNVAAAAAVCHHLGLSHSEITAGLASYNALPHRTQPVGAMGAIRFINDSKATNPEATEKALAAFEAIYWLAGGSDKGSDFSGLSMATGSVEAGYFFGETAPAIKTALPRLSSQIYPEMKDAFSAALNDAKSAGKGTILLSPACASFDQFENFAARGEAFMALAHAACGEAV